MDNFLDDDILENYNSKLLTEKNKPMKIHLDGFGILESFKLMRIIQKHGGELSSNPGTDVITLSPIGYRPNTRGDRFHVDWLHKSISSNAPQHLLEYMLEHSNTNIKHEAEESDDHPLESTNVGLKQDNTVTDCHSITDDLTISDFSSCSKTDPSANSNEDTDYHCASDGSASSDVVLLSDLRCSPTHRWINMNSNTVPEDASKIEQQSESLRQFDQQPEYTHCDLPKENKSLKMKRHRYTEEDKRQMIQYLIDKKAIQNAGGLKIWYQMHREGMMLHHSVPSMASYFCQTLIHKVEDYTSDEKALQLFRLRIDILQLRGSRRRRSD